MEMTDQEIKLHLNEELLAELIRGNKIECIWKCETLISIIPPDLKTRRRMLYKIFDKIKFDIMWGNPF